MDQTHKYMCYADSACMHSSYICLCANVQCIVDLLSKSTVNVSVTGEGSSLVSGW